MDLTGVTAYTAADDPNQLLGRQHEHASKVNWGTVNRNTIGVFATHAHAEARLD